MLFRETRVVSDGPECVFIVCKSASPTPFAVYKSEEEARKVAIEQTKRATDLWKDDHFWVEKHAIL